MRYGEDRYRPDGQWVQTTLAESVVGVHHRKPMAVAFARAARVAEAKGLNYGIELEHHPDIPHDPNAIAVFGVAERKGWFKRSVDRWHIGYLVGGRMVGIISHIDELSLRLPARVRVGKTPDGSRLMLEAS